MKKQSLVSIVIPVHNEEENIKKLYFELKEVLFKLIRSNQIFSYEIIFINDGSTDKTQEILESLKKTESMKLKIIEFNRNFAKAEAYKAGFELCSGDLIVTMDGDLQDNPQDLPKFIEKIEEGYDLVVGWKRERKDSLAKKLPSKAFNGILRRFTKLNLHDFDNGYRCMNKKVLEHLDIYSGLYRHIPVFASFKGFKIGEVRVNHREREFGKSKYGWSRIPGGFFDLITIRFLLVYLKKPLHFFGSIGSLFFSIGFFMALYLSYLRFFLDKEIGNRPLLILSVLLIIVGIQFFIFGLLGEMITNITKKEKNYVIKKTI